MHSKYGARCFYERRGTVREMTYNHIGTRPIIMQGVARHNEFEPRMVACARQLKQWMCQRDGNTFVAAVFCRAGEKRSVAFATFLAIALLESGVFDTMNSHVFHLNNWYWRRNTCEGTCNECRNSLRPQKRQRPDVAEALRIFGSI